METKLSYSFLILIVSCIKLNRNIFTKTLKDVRKRFDTSDYPEKHPSGIKSGVNKKVIGKFKDEAAGKQISHFVGLRSKLYSYKIEDDDVKKAKGMKKNVVTKDISFDDYKQCLFSGEEQMRTMNIIKSDKHEIYCMRMNKIALSANNDKRIVMRDKIRTKPLRQQN